MRYLVFIFLITGCASGNCRSQNIPNPNKAKEVQFMSEADKVWIFKYDGSKQCGMGKAISLEDMKKDLEGITIYASEKKSDGMMRTQVCGSPTGQTNRYQINKDQLELAQKKGFKLWIFE